MTPRPALRAAIWMLGAIFSFTAMAIAARSLGGAHDTFEIMTYRSIIGLAIVLAVAWISGTLHQITRRSLHLQLIRNVSHFAGQNLWFFAITAAPLAQVFALEFTSPIWAMFLAPFFLGEALTRMRLICALIGFSGILIVAQPGAGFTLTPGLIAAGLAALGFAGAAVFTRLLTRTETITCILFYLTVTQAVFGLVCAGYDGDITLPNVQTAPWLVLIGLAGLLAHFCMTKALSIAPASVVMPIDFARLPIIALVGVMLYAEPLEWTVLIGAVIIFAANYLNIRTEAHAPVPR